MNKIPAGYRFTFVSHDVRNENEKTIIKEGLTESEAHLFGDLAELIKDGTGLELDDLAEWRKKTIHQKLLDIFEKYPTICNEEKLSLFKEDVGLIVDFISENMLGYTHNDYENMRYLSHYKIEDIPEDILINDVTYSFNVKSQYKN